MSNTATIWICQCCMHNHVNGECGCGAYYGIDLDHDPLSLVDNNKITSGMLSSEHPCSADYEPLQERESECNCETNTFSTSPCQGCGSWLHGERHAMTLWV